MGRVRRPPIKIASLWVFIKIDKDGNETLCGVPQIITEWLFNPMVAVDEQRMLQLLPIAQSLARSALEQNDGSHIRLVKLIPAGDFRPMQVLSSGQLQINELDTKTEIAAAARKATPTIKAKVTAVLKKPAKAVPVKRSRQTVVKTPSRAVVVRRKKRA